MKTIEKMALKHAHTRHGPVINYYDAKHQLSAEDFMAGWRACREAMKKYLAKVNSDNPTRSLMSLIEIFGEEESNE